MRTVEEKNTACNVLHFSSAAGKPRSADKTIPLCAACSITYKKIFQITFWYNIVYNTTFFLYIEHKSSKIEPIVICMTHGFILKRETHVIGKNMKRKFRWDEGGYCRYFLHFCEWKTSMWKANNGGVMCSITSEGARISQRPIFSGKLTGYLCCDHFHNC